VLAADFSATFSRHLRSTYGTYGILITVEAYARHEDKSTTRSANTTTGTTPGQLLSGDICAATLAQIPLGLCSFRSHHGQIAFFRFGSRMRRITSAALL
jgi:hypothetical protein